VAVLVAQVRGRRAQRQAPADQRVSPAAGLGHHAEAGRDPARRAGAEPADREEPGGVRREAEAGPWAGGWLRGSRLSGKRWSRPTYWRPPSPSPGYRTAPGRSPDRTGTCTPAPTWNARWP